MTPPDRFDLILTEDAQEDLLNITDQRTLRAITKKIDGLETNPHAKGKQLAGDLRDYHSTRAAGQRYRVIYQIGMDSETRAVIIVVIAIRREGHRSDAYEIAKKRLT